MPWPFSTLVSETFPEIMIAEIIALLLFFTAVYATATIWQNRNLPPGPFPLPVLGNLLSIGQKMPYKDLANMASKYGKVFRVQMGSRKVIVISSYETAKEALVAKAKDFAGRPEHLVLCNIFARNCTDFAFQSYSHTWKLLRNMAVKAISLNEEKADVLLHIKELFAKFRSYNGKPFCPRDVVFQSFGNCMSSLIFGQEYKLDETEVDTLVEVVHVFRMSMGAANLIDAFPILKYVPFEMIKKAMRAGKQRDEIFERKFREHVSTFNRSNIRSVLDAMLKALKENCGDSQLTEENLISSASDIFIPGTETPSTLLIWILFYAVKYPDVQAKLHRELDDVIGNTNRMPELSDKPNLPYLEAFIAEVQRIVSETPLAVPHSTTRDTSLAGFFIPRDITVFINLWAIHHDPDCWEDPFCFRPERFLDEQGRLRVEGLMPFSAGIRSCPGETFARKAVFLYTARVLYSFKFECPDDEILPNVEDSDYGIVLDCKPFKIHALERTTGNW